MLENTIREEISRLLASVGLEAYHPPDVAKTKTSRPDIYSMNPKGASIVIEVKKIDIPVRVMATFEPLSISDSQRQWLDRWVYLRSGLGFLGIGTTDLGKRRLWIIPWANWVDFEMEHYLLHQETGNNGSFRIPLSSIEQKFDQYACVWFPKKDKRFPNSNWMLKEIHPIMTDKRIERQPMLPNEWTARFSLRFEKGKE